MIPIESHPLVLPPDLMALYDSAKATYVAGSHAEALHINEELRRQSMAVQCSLGTIVGQRFMGLCHYRLGDLEAARASFDEALRLAVVSGEIEQQLLIQNHLAACVRGLGQLQQAHDILERALNMAPLELYTHAHSRLLANKGALLDELGQRAAADDCYARFEVLSRLLGNDHRLANAVGLAARSALLREDFATAEEKYKEEARLATKVNDPLRKIAATLHLARLAARRGEDTAAERGFTEALEEARRGPHRKRLTDTLEDYADFLRKRFNLPLAYRYLLEALTLCNEPEKVANVNHGLALVCRDAGLYGESLEYLMRSVDARTKLYEPLRTLKERAKIRLDELKGITQELVDDALMVSRSSDTETALKELVNKVNDDSTAWDRFVGASKRRMGETIWQRNEDLKLASRKIWEERLLPVDFSLLSAPCRETLARAERSYSSAVDDLGRSAHLLALVLEHELKDRLFRPLFPPVPGKPERWMLSNMLTTLRDYLDPSRAPAPSNPLHRLFLHVQGHHYLITRICETLDEVKPLSGANLHIVSIRNGVAHGDEAVVAPLRRLQVDAIKRHLALEAPNGGLTIFQALARLPRLP